MIKYTLVGPFGVRVPVQINRRHLKKLQLITAAARFPNPWFLKLRVWKQNRNVQKSLKAVAEEQKKEERNCELPKTT